MGATHEFDSVAFKQMSRSERLRFTQNVRADFHTFIARFLASPTAPATHVIGLGRRKRAAWHMGWSSWDSVEGPCGWPMSVSIDGKFYKNFWRVRIEHLTAHQMIRAMAVLSRS